MKIETKFDVGDTVYLINHGGFSTGSSRLSRRCSLSKHAIVAINVDDNGIGYFVTYQSTVGMLKQEELFGLLKDVFDAAKDILDRKDGNQ